MRALVTGARGFVGPHLIDHLGRCGDDVLTMDLGSGPDLRDAQGWIDCMAERRPQVVYHLAGWSDVGGSWNEPAATFEVNALGTLAVLEAARLAKVDRVLVISSSEVYGVVDAEALPLNESQPLQPRSPYGASKQAAEAVAAHYWHGRGLETMIARPFNHLGPGQSPRFAAPAFATQVAEAEQRGGGTVRHGDLSPRRDLTDVRDVVRAYRLLMEAGSPGEIYNVCSGTAISMQSLLERLIVLSTSTITTQIDEALVRPVELPALCGTFDRLNKATGWEPEITIDQTLEAVLGDARLRIAPGRLNAG